MTGFTLGNISVVGTYYTHGLNLTPRGLLAVTAAASLLSCAAASCTVPYRFSRGVGYPIGYPSPIYIPCTLFNISSTAGSSRPILAASSQLLPALQLAASRQLAQLSALPALFILRIFSGNRYQTVTVIRTI